ncbi:MAG: 4Fe-4S dicluster domain-containing protein [Candidatus Bathyarchaeia archaeon]
MPKKRLRTLSNTVKISRSKAEIHIIKDQCKGCGFCIHYCPKKVLEKSNEINARGVHPPKVGKEGECIICGLCMALCPDFAIFVEEKLCREKC